jgi:hypothetical protein
LAGTPSTPENKELDNMEVDKEEYELFKPFLLDI